MKHIEAKTGKSYSISDMSDDHLIKTIELLLARCKTMNKTADNNPRYINDIEQELSRLAQYHFEAHHRELLNILQKQEIENMYYEYKRNRAKTFIPH